MKKILTIRIFILVIAVLFIFPSFAAETCRKFVATDNSGMKFVIELTFSDERTAGFDAVIYKKSQPSNKIYGYGIGALEDTRKSMYFDSGLFRILFPKGPLTKLGLETIGASAMIPQTVQGRPYAPAKGKVSKAWGPDPIPIVDFDFADIQAWAGEGDKKCAFVIQWSDDDEDNALMFGYRWSGEATGTDVAKAVVEMHPKLFGAFTDGGQYGTTIDGFGWDGNDDGVFSVTLSDGSVVEPGANGFMQGGAAGYDGSYATDAGDRWHGGWFEGYWSYWTFNPGDENFSYSQVGASGRKLEDGCIDGWIFAPQLQTSTWKERVAAPLPGLALGQKFGDGTFKYVVTSVGAHPELEVESIINKNLNKAVKVPQSITDNTSVIF